MKMTLVRHLLSECLVIASTLLSAAGEERFGFRGPEIFPIDSQITLLNCADLDGDGRQDLIVANNSRSKINLLINQTGRPAPPLERAAKPRQELNQLPADARFRIDAIASEKRIAGMVVADLNSDGRPDIAYYGEPKELVLQYNQGTNGWSAAKRWPISDGHLHSSALISGDLNGDGLTDLLLLGSEGHLYWLSQNAGHLMEEPERIPYSGTVKGIQLLDVNGDGREDLVLVNWDSANPVRVRLQNEAGQLGPELHFTMPPIRSLWGADLDGDHQAELITIAQQSGRAQISQFQSKPAELLFGNLHQGPFEVLPLPKSDKEVRGWTWADLNRDQLPDLLVAEPDRGLLTVYYQKPQGGLTVAKSFATLTGVSEIAVADWDGDGRPEIFLLSREERQLGITQLDSNGRLPFPKSLPLDGNPLVMAVGELKPKAPPMLAVIVDREGKRELLTRSATGTGQTQKLSENFKSNPLRLTIFDATQDGLPDLIVLIEFEKIKTLIQRGDPPFEEQDLAAPGGGADQPWLSQADVDGDGKPELLLAQKHFVRAVVLKPEDGSQGKTTNWTFVVKEQINGAGSSSRITAAAALPRPDRAVPSIFLLDAAQKALSLSERDDSGVWRVVRNVPLPVSAFNRIEAIGLGSATPNSLLFFSLNAIAWMGFHGDKWELVELDDYETPVKDGFLNDVVAGDLDQDRRNDLVFLETAKNYVDIVRFDVRKQLVPGDRWQVFEERTFRNRRNEFPEPREALVADLTGDGKNDLVVLVHDRILVYPQD